MSNRPPESRASPSDEQTRCRYREIDPGTDLRDFVVGFWEFEVLAPGSSGYEHHIPPDGCSSVLVRYAADAAPLLLFLGPRTETHKVLITEVEQYVGFRLWPHTMQAVLGVNPQDLVGAVGPAEFFVPAFARCMQLPSEHDTDACCQTMRAAINAALDSSAVDELVDRAVRRIVVSGGTDPVSRVAEHLGVSIRSLQRRFRAATGLSPKQFARLRRFRHATLELIRDRNRGWAEVAFESGYADQSHLVREFSQLIGLTAEQLRQKHSAIEHEDVS